MHPEALDAVKRMTTASGYTKLVSGPLRHPRTGLDIGGADINGSARALIPAVDHWHGLDIAPGPGVDIVADATNAVEMLFTLAASAYDVILCTEVLEHVKNWRSIVHNIWYFLAPGGFAFITAAATDGISWARRPHGARGDLDPAPGEHYENVRVTDLSAAIEVVVGNSNTDGKYGISARPIPGDVYAWIRKD